VGQRRDLLSWAGLGIRLVVGCVWVVAGALKLPDPEQSVRAVRAYRLLPEPIVPAVGYGLPILEVAIGVLLVIGLGTRVAAVVSALLFLLFVVGIASAWARGLQIDCGCFGGGGFDANATEQYPWEIARDGVLLVLSAYLVVRPQTVLAVDNRVLLRRDV
jgi:uncharacterized membrane protein YphA (DoxX/SURF4 family)